MHVPRPYPSHAASEAASRNRAARDFVRRLAGFFRSRDGVAAIEFGFILPIMLTIYAGMAECTQAVTNWRKVTLLARAVADLTSQGDQQNPMSTGVTNDILGAAGAILRPFNAANARITVSAMAVDTLPLAGPPRVCSSYPPSAARRGPSARRPT